MKISINIEDIITPLMILNGKMPVPLNCAYQETIKSDVYAGKIISNLKYSSLLP